MSSATIIEQIKELPPAQQAEVIQFAVEFAQSRQLAPEELGLLAKKLSETNDPVDIIRLKSALRQGFYGE